MDVAVALGITPAPVLHRCLDKTQMVVATELGITPVPVLRRCLHRTCMDVAKTLGLTPEPVKHRHLWRTQKHVAKTVRHLSKACRAQTSLQDMDGRTWHHSRTCLADICGGHRWMWQRH